MNFAQMLFSVPKKVNEQPEHLRKASIRLTKAQINKYRKAFQTCGLVSTSFAIAGKLGLQKVTVGKWLKRYEGKLVERIGIESYYAGRPRFIWKWVENEHK